ncbi:heat shock protein HslJ [Crenobacter luteus]|uniref:META and DUF4377 domain-containing protein n=1 Tax=Crenobacter luteus TaxID=1452487 RepID=UPI00104BA2AF|nr:META and DUF4377 domain-containing protein [Crenobacter luteus]TCP09108.1 heat shock protein HslJ [Crenobacter luteus]
MPRHLPALAILSTLAAAPAFAAPNLSGTEWRLVSPQAERAPTIRFDDGRASGFSGCNRFVWTRQDGKSQVAGTRMMCAPAAMRTEQAFLALLEAGPRVETDDRATTLSLVAGDTRYTFARVGAPSSAVPVAEHSEYLTVAPFTRPCSAGAGKMDCLQVKGADGAWQHFYGGIEGFTPEPGVGYTLKVRVIPVANPPADAPNRRVVLERVVMTEKAERLD